MCYLTDQYNDHILWEEKKSANYLTNWFECDNCHIEEPETKRIDLSHGKYCEDCMDSEVIVDSIKSGDDFKTIKKELDEFETKYKQHFGKEYQYSTQVNA